MKVFSIVFIVIVTTITGLSQEFSKGEWTDGSITFPNKEVLSGLIYYQIKTGTVFIQREDEMRSLKASKVSKFNFYDKEQNKIRLFISLPMEVPNRTTFRYEFLEVIKDFGDWQILAQLSSRKVVLPAHRYTPAQTITQVVESWHIIDADGSKHLYLSFMHRQLLGEKLEFYNANLFQKLTSINSKKIKEYISDNKLNPEEPYDNLRILEQNELIRKTKDVR